MITARLLRTATAAAVATVLLALAGALPATATPAQANGYPQDRGVYTLTSTTVWNKQLMLQDTNWVYAHHPQARDVVASPRDRQTASQQWRFIEVSEEHFRLINVQTGRALQRTGNANGGGATRVASTPASWNSPEQIWNIPDFGERSSSIYAVSNPAAGSFDNGRLVSDGIIDPTEGVSEVQAGLGTNGVDATSWLIQEHVYPRSWGTVTVQETMPDNTVGVLQETGEVYPFHSAARNVVTSPADWNHSHQKWQLWEVSAGIFRFISAESGQALQATGNSRGASASGRYVVTTPAAWNSSEQEWLIYPAPNFGTFTVGSELTVQIENLSAQWESVLRATSTPHGITPDVMDVQVGGDGSLQEWVLTVVN